MNSIQSFLYRGDNKQASAYLSKFALLVRMTMEDVQNGFISLEREITRLKLYLAMEQLRFGEGLKFNIIIDPAIYKDRIRIPNMILQPYIENAIWHGIMPNDGNGTISIHFKVFENDKLKIIIQDDGIGFDVNKVKKNADSLGMKITERRIMLLKRLLSEYYSVKIISNINAGTTVEITLPQQPDDRYLRILEKELNTF